MKESLYRNLEKGNLISREGENQREKIFKKREEKGGRKLRMRTKQLHCEEKEQLYINIFFVMEDVSVIISIKAERL